MAVVVDEATSPAARDSKPRPLPIATLIVRTMLSDIFSLGVAFYELLAGRRPFRGDTHAELFEQVTRNEVKPGP